MTRQVLDESDETGDFFVDAEEIRSRLLRLVHSHCPPGLRGEAEDLAQAAWVRVLAVLRSEGKRRVPTSYLWKTAFCVVVDEIRRRQRRPEVALEEAGPLVPTTRRPDPEQETRERSLERAVVGCLKKVVENRRRAVVLRLQGHTVVEVGRLLGWGAKKAENLVYRGLADLQACLRRRGYEP